MSSSMSILVDKLLHKNKCKDIKGCLKYETITHKELLLNCPDCNKISVKVFHEDLKKWFANTCKFCKGGINGLYIWFDVSRRCLAMQIHEWLGKF